MSWWCIREKRRFINAGKECEGIYTSYYMMKSFGGIKYVNEESVCLGGLKSVIRWTDVGNI